MNKKKVIRNRSATWVAFLVAMSFAAGDMAPLSFRTCTEIGSKKSFLREMFANVPSVRTASAEAFKVGRTGCPMAHCDALMSDDTLQRVPNEAILISHSSISEGSMQGLGCVSNGTLAACTFNREQDALEVYDYDGTRLWGSGNALNSKAWVSAPLIDPSGHVIAADTESIIRFDEAGRQIWAADMPGDGAPISPVPNDHGIILVATRDGLVSTFQPDGASQAIHTVYVSWSRLGRTLLRESRPSNDSYYGTVNTPAFNRAGNRAYIVMAKNQSRREGALVALNVGQNGRLSLAWAYQFSGPSGASPLVVENVGKDCPTNPAACKTVIYFDGRYDSEAEKVRENAEILAVEDRGKYPTLLWRHRESPADFLIRRKTIRASFTADPRGCMWYYSGSWEGLMPGMSEMDAPYLRCLAYEDGLEVMEFKPGCLLGHCDRYSASSVISMAQDAAGAPVLILTISGMPADGVWPTLVAAIRPEIDNSHSLLWSFELSPGNSLISALSNGSQGQFPILAARTGSGDSDDSGASSGSGGSSSSGGTRIVFTTHANGVYVVGDPD